MTEPEIRAMRVEEIPLIVDLVRESFDTRLGSYMIYGQPGIGAFLSVPYKYPQWKHDRKSIVAVIDDRILGFAEFRLIDGEVGFLSYICVASHARGKGIAKQLIAAFLIAHPSLNELNLDVFHTNVEAVGLYEKLGFRRIATSAWVTKALPPPKGSVGIPSLPAAMAAFDAHGFCEVDAIVDEEVIRVGFIGKATVRCSTTSSFENNILLAGLKAVFPHLDQAFAVIPEGNVSSLNAAHEVLTLSDRMTLAI
jgi:ribosomal protein S18 acetylase RimI-like enzyme